MKSLFIAVVLSLFALPVFATSSYAIMGGVTLSGPGFGTAVVALPLDYDRVFATEYLCNKALNTYLMSDITRSTSDGAGHFVEGSFTPLSGTYKTSAAKCVPIN